MIVDLNLKGKNVLVAGGGSEASRKVEALLSQDCGVIVVTEAPDPQILSRAEEGKITLIKTRLCNGAFVREHENLILVMAVTDDQALNKAIVEVARSCGLFAYAADDPDNSDFAHPAVINLFDCIQVAVSTGGKSPLMAKNLRERAEQVFRDIIKKEDILQIRLQDKMRRAAKKKLSESVKRKQFLDHIFRDETIRKLLSEDQYPEAENAALKILEEFSKNF